MISLDERIEQTILSTMNITKAERGAPMLTKNPMWFKVNDQDFYATVYPEAIRTLISSILDELIPPTKRLYATIPETDESNLPIIGYNNALKNFEANRKRMGL